MADIVVASAVTNGIQNEQIIQSLNAALAARDTTTVEFQNEIKEMSSISLLQAQEMIARCERNRKKPSPDPYACADAYAMAEQKEVGREGIQAQIEQWLRQNEHSLKIMWTRNRTDKPSSCELARPDYVGCIQGRCWVVEIKRKGQKPTVTQKGELLRWKMSGAITGVAHSLAEFKALLGVE